jgi:hypothetical protein
MRFSFWVAGQTPAKLSFFGPEGSHESVPEATAEMAART